MPRFKCSNDKCSEFGKEEYFPNVKFIWNEKTHKLDAKEAICPECKSNRETIREEGDIKMPWFKAENARNNNNKTIKKYDYDHDAATAVTGNIGKGGVT